ncbi:menaquinone reductase multiheme cytochrome c subunit QrcA [Desulfovibrio inopinatus]|uniref:menaquinone reductase multiheme cytochrome c subunit QrcA n=1 Tax=Desulfovibrio inopinatus TaxID=102109 RepID=UPI0004137030|nr:menaquinone reductase multiheme cytochrome c subunit QrcA [Desulfovibrio inopinatus]
MEEKKTSTSGSGGFIPLFILGFVGALIVGWWVFPQLLFSSKTQPIQFSHTVHTEQGMDCTECHYFLENGQYVGFPSTESCYACHADTTGGETAAEKEIDKFVTEYGEKNAEIPWLTYQKQPDNVYFTHSVHQNFECTTCHPDVATMTELPAYKENRISGYSKQTMKMWQCERCHAEMGASNACYVCHK